MTDPNQPSATGIPSGQPPTAPPSPLPPESPSGPAGGSSTGSPSGPAHGAPIQADPMPPPPEVLLGQPPTGIPGPAFQEPATEVPSGPTPFQPPTEAPSEPGGSPPAGGEEMENPFVPPPMSKPPSSGLAIKKILAVVVLIFAVLAVLFIIFSLIRSVVGRNKDITLTYWGLWEEERVMKTLIDTYQTNNPNVTITYIKESPRQYRERLQTSIGNGTGPDIFRFHNTWVPMLQDELAPAPEDVFATSDFEQTFYPVAKNDLIVGGRILGVPLEIDGLGLYYNEDLLRSAGASPPQTWEELQETARKVTVKDKDGNILTAGIALGTASNIEHFSDTVAVMMLQNGADLKNPTSQEAHEALTFYRLFAEPPNNVWDDAQDNSILAFANGNVGMIIAPSWQSHTISEINPQLKYRVIALPQLPGANIAWASYWVEGVSSASENQEAAWEFLTYLSSREALIQFYTEATKIRSFGEPYSRVDLGQELASDPIVGAYVQQAPIARSFFLSSRTRDNGINDRMIKYAEDAINSLSLGVGPSEAVGTMAAGFAQVLRDFGLSSSN